MIQKGLCNFVQLVKYVPAIRIDKTEYTGILSESVQSPVLKTFFEIPVPRWRVPSSFPPLLDPVRRRRRYKGTVAVAEFLHFRFPLSSSLGSPAQKDRKAKEEHRQSIALRVQCLCLPPPPLRRVQLIPEAAACGEGGGEEGSRAGERSLGKKLLLKQRKEERKRQEEPRGRKGGRTDREKAYSGRPRTTQPSSTPSRRTWRSPGGSPSPERDTETGSPRGSIAPAQASGGVTSKVGPHPGQGSQGKAGLAGADHGAHAGPRRVFPSGAPGA